MPNIIERKHKTTVFERRDSPEAMSLN